MSLTKRRWLAGAAASLVIPALRAQRSNWPTHPLRLLVGFPGGSSPDLAARAVAEPLGKALGQAVIIDNKPGASGNLAADAVAKASDAHTFGVLINNNLTIAKLLNAKLPFDPARDFAPLSLLGTAPLVLAVSSDAPGSTPPQLLAWLKALRDQGNYGSPGIGTVGHLGMELLKSRSGIAAQHIPFAGNPQVINALIAGQIHAALLPPALAAAQIKGGRLKGVAVSSAGRSVLAPEWPTLREVGVDVELEIWTAFAAPANLPAPIAARLSNAVIDVARTSECRARLLAAGWQVTATSPDGLAHRMRSDTAALGAIIRERGIRSDA